MASGKSSGMAATISVLIITYNRQDDLLALFRSLMLQQDKDKVLKEILVLNNASTQPYLAAEAFMQAHPELKIRYIRSDRNHGVAGGRNILMKEAKGDLMLTIDDDMEFPQRDALVRMSGLFDNRLFKESNTGVITVRVIYFSTKEVQKTVFPHKKYDRFKGLPRFLTLYFAGGANLMKREVIEKTGVFPENFFYGMEEYDLCYRILDSGYTIGYDDSVTIEHKESPHGRQANYRKLQMQWINKSIVTWRYLPFIYFISTAVLWSFQYLMHAPTHVLFYFKGWLDIFKIPFREKRRPVKKSTLDYLDKVEARLWY